MQEVWTHGTWTVKPGREGDFVRAWEELGDWTLSAFPGAHGTLLRDSERPNVFISFGPWPDRETAVRWRASDAFQNHLATIRETLERFEPMLLEHVVTKRRGQDAVRLGGRPTIASGKSSGTSRAEDR